MKPAVRRMISFGLILFGMSFLLAPMLSDRISRNKMQSMVNTYNFSSKEKTEKGQTDVIFCKAEEYNKRLRLGKGTTAEEYLQLLSGDGNGMMGYIEIPAIDVTVPVFHHDDAGMSRGAIHVLGSSLPVGGKGTHSVIAAHTGNENGKFFTDLTKLKIGDSFRITVLDRKLDYEIDQIETVLPEDNKWLKIRRNEDYCTLLTCTPYGVNSHRLLVRGRRMKSNDGSVNQQDEDYILTESRYIEPDMLGVGMLFIIITIWTIMINKEFIEKGGGRD